LFAGVSLEGSAIVERRDANEKLYGQRFTASQLMEGSVRPPPAAASLMNVLNSRVFAGVGGGDDSMYNDVPQYDDRHDDVVWEGRRGSGYGEGVKRNKDDDYSYSDRPKRANTWADDVYDRSAQSGIGRGNSLRNSNRTSGFDDDYTYSDSPTSGKAGPGRPAAPKPQFLASKTGSLKDDQAVALFTFDADQPGDLGFKKGDIITVVKKTDKAEDWW
jgi:SH3 domain-containing YSC84-like protein 1